MGLIRLQRGEQRFARDSLLLFATDGGRAVEQLMTVVSELGVIAAVDLDPLGVRRQQSFRRQHSIGGRHAVVNIAAHWEQIGRAHAEVFGEVRPATSMVEVSRLIHPDMLVEIEVVAGAYAPTRMMANPS